MATCAGCPAELPPTKINQLTGVVANPRRWCSERCRKSQYAGLCVDCGAATHGSNGRGKRAPTRCQDCSRKHETATATWTRERLIVEAKRWRDLTGAWPTATHWSSGCGSRPSEELLAAVLEFRSLTGPWPRPATVQAVFGSWAAFMAAAGGEAFGTSAGVKNGQRAAEMRAALAKLNGTRPNGDS